MSNIINIEGKYYDFGTQNSSFLLTAQELKSVGIKHFYFMLEVKFPNLGVQDIDPYDPNISAEDIGKLVVECKANPWFFFREVGRVPVRGAGSFPFALTRASAAAIWCYMHSIDFLLCQPRQTWKSTTLTEISTYNFIFEFQNATIPYMHIRQDRCLENAEMLRDYICALPPYFNPWKGKTKLPGLKSLKYEEHKMSVAVLSSADSPVKAKDKMRGMTLFTCFIDEWEYIPYISNVLEGATPAIISGRETMKKTGGRSCMMLASTPGDLETSTGKEAQRMIDRTPLFSEQLYDFTQEELKNYFDGVTHPDEHGNPVQITMLYIEFNYKQLRKDEKWLREQYNEALRLDKLAEYRRGVLLQRFRGSDTALFRQEDIDYLVQNCREPDYDIFIMKKYHLFVYKHKIDHVDLTSEYPYFDVSIPYLIGVDPSSGSNGDNTAICIIHPYTLEVCGELLSPYLGLLDLFRVLTQLAIMIPKGVFCVETNNVGKVITEFVQESHLEHRFYHDPKLDITKNAITLDHREPSVQTKSELRGYIGTFTTAKVRDSMFELLFRHIKDYRHLLLAKYLVKDIQNLVRSKSGKIQADDGEHDDMVMAYLHAIYVHYYGYNLNRFGVDKRLCTFEKANDIIEDYEQAVADNTVDNLVPYGFKTMYEEQCLQDKIAAAQDTDVDIYGYKKSQYNQGYNTRRATEDDGVTYSDVQFFRELNSHIY